MYFIAFALLSDQSRELEETRPSQSRVRHAGRWVKERERGMEGLRGEGKGGRAPSLFQRVGIPPELPPTRPPPHLAGTCENNSPAFSHSADPIAISTLEGSESERQSR